MRKTLSRTSLAFAFAAALLSASALAGGTYSVAVLGDTHFDGASNGVYHAIFVATNTPTQRRLGEFQRNAEMWQARMPALLAASGALARERPTRFVLQLGDLVQGDCDDAPTHTRMLEDAIRTIRAAYPDDLPFLTVVGNHDKRGKGAKEAYFKFIEPYLSSQLGRAVSYPAFSFPMDDDLWVFCDFETPNLDPISDIIDAHPDARYVFLVTHGPLTAPDSKHWYWRLGGDPASGRQRLWDILLRRHAIVLSGHSHSTTLFRHESELGGFAELTMNSVWDSTNRVTTAPIHDTPVKYGTRGRKKIPEERLESYDRDMAEFRKSLKEYFLCRGAGHYRLDISDDGVTCAFFPGDAREPGRLFRLATP